MGVGWVAEGGEWACWEEGHVGLSRAVQQTNQQSLLIMLSLLRNLPLSVRSPSISLSLPHACTVGVAQGISNDLQADFPCLGRVHANGLGHERLVGFPGHGLHGVYVCSV